MSNNDFYLSVQRHLDLTEAVLNISQDILKAAPNGDMDSICLLLDNRERLMNLVSERQAVVEDLIGAISDINVIKTLKPIIDSWIFDTQKWSSQVQTIDQQLVQIFQEQKSKTQTELSDSFKYRQKFGGYDLSSTKK